MARGIERKPPAPLTIASATYKILQILNKLDDASRARVVRAVVAVVGPEGS